MGGGEGSRSAAPCLVQRCRISTGNHCFLEKDDAKPWKRDRYAEVVIKGEDGERKDAKSHVISLNFVDLSRKI